jgi:hypothetical protein
MDVDEDEDNTQQPKVVADFGIEVDFEALEDEEKEVKQPSHPAKLTLMHHSGWERRHGRKLRRSDSKAQC